MYMQVVLEVLNYLLELKSMFNDMKTPLIGLSSVIGIVMIIINLIRMKMSDDVDTKMYKKE